MVHVTLVVPPRKDSANGKHRRGRPDEGNLASDLQKWLADLDETEALRRQQLKELGETRRAIYRLAKQRGVPAAMLRVLRSLKK